MVPEGFCWSDRVNFSGIGSTCIRLLTTVRGSSPFAFQLLWLLQVSLGSSLRSPNSGLRVGVLLDSPPCQWQFNVPGWLLFVPLSLLPVWQQLSHMQIVTVVHHSSPVRRSFRALQLPNLPVSQSVSQFVSQPVFGSVIFCLCSVDFLVVAHAERVICLRRFDWLLVRMGQSDDRNAEIFAQQIFFNNICLTMFNV